MESLELFIERSTEERKPLTLMSGAVLYASGLDVPQAYMQTIADFPALFADKLLVVQPGIDDQRKKPINNTFAQKVFSIAAAFLGYSPSGRGFRMPKTRLSLDFTGQHKHSGTHRHVSSTSWSHQISIKMNNRSFEGFLRTLVHEMIHGQQHTKRRLTRTSAGQMMWDRQEVEIYQPDENEDGYWESPWEKEAHARAPEVVNEILNYLRSGVGSGGFNPKRV